MWSEACCVSSVRLKQLLTRYYLSRRRLCFWFRLFVCLSVRRITKKNCERILTKFLEGYGMAQGPTTSILVTIQITVQIQESEVRNPYSLDYRKSYKRILMKFSGELGCGLETNWLHFGDDPHHYPDPGVRSGSRSGSGKDCHNSIMLVFGGGLWSLSTSSLKSIRRIFTKFTARMHCGTAMKASSFPIGNGTYGIKWLYIRSQFTVDVRYICLAVLANIACSM